MMAFRTFMQIGATVAVVAAAPAVAQPADFVRQADAIVDASYPADGPGAAVVVMRGGRVIYSRGRGLADVEARRAITPDTVFRLGSITKQFTAAVILQLVAEGRISLDDPISRFFPDYPQPGATATVRQLLNHTSGIQSYTGIPGWMTEEHTNHAYTTAEMITQFRDLPSRTPPGQAWAYNNSGYLMLGGIIEQVTGKPWHQVVVERIARPLGLTSIAYGESVSGSPAMAHGYTITEGRAAPARRIHMSVPHAAGGLVGTVGDLAKWAQALHHGRVVSPALYQQMIAPTRLPDGSTVPYGYGITPDTLRGRPAIGHNGGIFGFSTDSLYVPGDDLFVAVFANSDEPVTHPSLVLKRIAALAVGDPYPKFTTAAVDPAAIEPLLGVYRVGENGPNRRFFARDGKLYTAREGGTELEAFAAGNDRFYYGPNNLTWFELQRQADGSHVMLMHQQGDAQAERAVRMGPVPPEAPTVAVDPAVLRSYVGAYTTPGPAVTIAIAADGRLTIELTGEAVLAMRPLSATEFEVERVNARVRFRSENGRVIGLTIMQGGRELEGRRTAP